MQILIYTHQINPRIQFVTKLIFETILGIKFSITKNADEFINSEFFKLNYSAQSFDDSFTIQPHSLLFEDKIKMQEIDIFEWQGHKAFFKTNNSLPIPFDLFAASFFLVTRYEEYLPFEADSHGRYDVKQSTAYKFGFLNEPLVNQWVKQFALLLSQKFPVLQIPPKHFSYIPTIDIDNAFAYKHKGVYRTTGALAKSLLKMKFNEFSDRINVLSGSKNDPYDSYDYLIQLHGKYKLKPVFFFLLGLYEKFGKNISPTEKVLKDLIKKLAKAHEVGIHPSYTASEDDEQLKKEIDILSDILSTNIIRSRQHFLKLSFPVTYRRLAKYNIREDYTMGYPSLLGFRASICTPYSFYNLTEEKNTSLLIFPFQVMDATLMEYMHLSAQEALEKIIDIIDKIKKVDGTFISLWHNESLSDKDRWSGWRNVYETMLETVHNVSN